MEKVIVKNLIFNGLVRGMAFEGCIVSNEQNIRLFEELSAGRPRQLSNIPCAVADAKNLRDPSLTLRRKPSSAILFHDRNGYSSAHSLQLSSVGLLAQEDARSPQAANRITPMH